MKNNVYTETLSSTTIDRFAEIVEEFIKFHVKNNKAAIRSRLAMEEALLRIVDNQGEGLPITLETTKSLGQITIRISVKSPSFNPLKDNSDEDFGNGWYRNLLNDLDITPAYSYSMGKNILTFKFQKKKFNPLVTLALFIVAGLITGLLGIYMGGGIPGIIANDYLAPISTTYMGMLNLCGIPIMFISVCSGIYNLGDVNTFGRIGRSLILRFLQTLTIVSVLVVLVSFMLFSLRNGSSAISLKGTDLLNMILSFLPVNVFSPFIGPNALQVICLGILFGIAILKMDPAGKPVSALFDSLYLLLLEISRWIARIMPFIVFVIIVQEAWQGDTRTMLPFWRPWIICTALYVIFIGFNIIQFSVKNHVSPLIICKKLLHTFALSLATNSCSASISENYAACASLGIDNKLTSFAIPITTSLFKPTVAIRYIVLSFYFAMAYGISISWYWALLLVILAVIFSIAAPSIPGGAAIFYGMLFVPLGIPASAVGTAIAVDIFFDCISTAATQTFGQLTLLRQASRLGMLDHEIMKKQ